MRLLFTLACLLFLTAGVAQADIPPATAPTQTVKLKAKSIWTSTAPMETIKGSAKGKAKLTMSNGDFSTLTGDIVIKVKSMRSGNKTRDEHLKSAQWLDEANHPKIIFSIAKVEVGKVTSEKRTHGDQEVEHQMHEVIASGQVSIHGVSQPLTASAVIDAFATNSKKKVKISTQFKVTLNDFNIKGKEGLVGDKVGESIDIEAVLKGIIL